MEEQKQNIESSFSKKLKVKKQKVLLANTDDTMEQTNTTIKPKEEEDFMFYVEYEDKDEDNINHDTFDEAKVEYDLFISRGEERVVIWRRYGYGNDDIEIVYPKT